MPRLILLFVPLLCVALDTVETVVLPVERQGNAIRCRLIEPASLDGLDGDELTLTMVGTVPGWGDGRAARRLRLVRQGAVWSLDADLGPLDAVDVAPPGPIDLGRWAARIAAGELRPETAEVMVLVAEPGRCLVWHRGSLPSGPVTMAAAGLGAVRVLADDGEFAVLGGEHAWPADALTLHWIRLP